MAIRATGLKINDKELQKFADRIVEKYVDRYISAGDKAQKEIRKKYTIEWFLHGSTTMTDALEYEHKLVQKNGFATIYFTSYVNMGKFSANMIANNSQIFTWANHYHAGIDPASYVLDLQWNQGIHGLPYEWSRPNYRFGQHYGDGVTTWYNPYFNQGIPLSKYVEYGFKGEWEQTVNRFVKK